MWKKTKKKFPTVSQLGEKKNLDPKFRLTFASIGAVWEVCRAYGEALLLAPLRVMISSCGRLVLVLVFVARSLLAHFLYFPFLSSHFFFSSFFLPDFRWPSRMILVGKKNDEA
jgi:hypothetical protein